MGKILEKSEKVDFNEGEGCTIYPYNTHNSKNHEKARQKQPITPIIPKVVDVIVTLSCTVILMDNKSLSQDSFYFFNGKPFFKNFVRDRFRLLKRF